MIIKLPKDPDDYVFNFHSVQQARGYVSIAPEAERADGVSEAEERCDEVYVHRLMRAVQAKDRAGPPDYEPEEEKWAQFQACDQERVESWIEENGGKEFERRAWLILGLIRDVHTQGAPADMMKQYLDDMMLRMYLIVGLNERMDRIVQAISAHPSIAWDFLRHSELPGDQEANRHIALMLHSWGPKVNERWTAFRERGIRPFDDSPLQEPEASEPHQSGTKVDRTAQKGSSEVKIEDDDLIDLESTPSEALPPSRAGKLRQMPKFDPLNPAGDVDMARIASQKRQALAAASAQKAKAKFSEPQSRGFPTATPTKRKRTKEDAASDADKANTSRQNDSSRPSDASTLSDATRPRLVKQASNPRKASEKDPALAATLEQMIKDNIGNFAGHKKSHRRETGFFGPGSTGSRASQP